MVGIKINETDFKKFVADVKRDVENIRRGCSAVAEEQSVYLKERMRAHIDSDVYEVYDPEKYKRTYDLRDFVDSSHSSDGNVFSGEAFVNPELAEQPQAHGKDYSVAVEFYGSTGKMKGGIFALGQEDVPVRPFTENTWGEYMQLNTWKDSLNSMINAVLKGGG